MALNLSPLDQRSKALPRMPTRSEFFHPTSLLFLAICLTSTHVCAQAVGGGQIQGIVTDSSGAVVPGATVEADQTESGFKREATSGADASDALRKAATFGPAICWTREAG